MYLGTNCSCHELPHSARLFILYMNAEYIKYPARGRSVNHNRNGPLTPYKGGRTMCQLRIVWRFSIYGFPIGIRFSLGNNVCTSYQRNYCVRTTFQRGVLTTLRKVWSYDPNNNINQYNIMYADLPGYKIHPPPPPPPHTHNSAFLYCNNCTNILL